MIIIRIQRIISISICICWSAILGIALTDKSSNKSTLTTNNNINIEETKLPIAGISKYITDIVSNPNISLQESEPEIDESEQATEDWHIGYTNAYVNIRAAPSINSEVYTVYPYNMEISYTPYDSEWYEIKYGVSKAYIALQFVSDDKIDYVEIKMPNNNGFKSYMDYRTITDKESSQYLLQKDAYSGNYGIREVSGRYCVALGTYFNLEIGRYFDLILEDDTSLPCVVGDIKANKDTLSDNITTAHNGCVSEFIVDTNELHNTAKINGDISYCEENWGYKVVAIRVYDTNYFTEE